MGDGWGWRVGLMAAVVAAAALTPVAVRAAPDPNDYTTTELWIPSGDGTLLHTHVYRPAALGPHDKSPVILEVTPYQVSGADPLNPTAVANPPSYGRRSSTTSVPTARPTS